MPDFWVTDPREAGLVLEVSGQIRPVRTEWVPGGQLPSPMTKLDRFAASGVLLPNHHATRATSQGTRDGSNAGWEAPDPDPL